MKIRGRLIGRTSHFDCENRGSSPCPEAMTKLLQNRTLQNEHSLRYCTSEQ